MVLGCARPSELSIQPPNPSQVTSSLFPVRSPGPAIQPLEESGWVATGRGAPSLSQSDSQADEQPFFLFS